MERRIMQNWERSEFDEQWKDAFEGAEIAPSPSVWANVDQKLTLLDHQDGKRRIVFYQRLAAACVLFALMAGGFGVYHWKQSEISVAQLNSEKTPEATAQKKSTVGDENVSSQNQVESNSVTENATKPLNSKKSRNAATSSRLPSDEKNSAANSNSRLSGNKAVQSNSRKAADAVGQSKSSLDKNGTSSTRQAPVTDDSSNGNTVAQVNSEKVQDVKSLVNSTDENNQPQQYMKKNSANDGKSVAAVRDQNDGSNVAATNAMPKEKSVADGNSKAFSSANGESRNNASLATSVDLPELEQLPIAEIQGEPRFAEIYRKLPYIPSSFMNESRSKKFEHEKLWASVTAASGAYTEGSGASYNTMAAMNVYNSAFAQSSPPQASGLFNLSNSNTATAPTVGKSYSYGVIGGVRLAERWVLQTGVQYMNQTMGNSSSQYVNYGSGSLISTNEFLSVPVQAGYLLINRKMGWQLNPGISTDFFVRNTLSNQQLSMSQGAGADSPYRSVNFAGLMSSEFSYKLGKNYRLSLVPGMRYSFNPALKSVTTGSGIAWDVGFRFRYIFK